MMGPRQEAQNALFYDVSIKAHAPEFTLCGRSMA